MCPWPQQVTHIFFTTSAYACISFRLYLRHFSQDHGVSFPAFAAPVVFLHRVDGANRELAFGSKDLSFSGHSALLQENSQWDQKALEV